MIAVPLGALAGIVVLGAIALLLTLSFLAFGDIGGGWGTGSGGSKRTDEHEPAEEPNQT